MAISMATQAGFDAAGLAVADDVATPVAETLTGLAGDVLRRSPCPVVAVRP